jgi:lysophospholipid acyltransferase (LPLAT)-like uncharacterized protein
VRQLIVKDGKSREGRLDPEKDDPVAKSHRFADLSGYSLRKRWTIRAADIGFYGLISAIGRTLRFQIEGWEHFEAVYHDGRLPIGAFWHDGIFLSTYFWRHRGLVVITSQSFDGEYIARFIQRFGFGVVRGSSTRGGAGALIEMIRLMRLGQPTAFTIDGPKGPRHVAKMGPVLLAKKTGHPILAVSATPARFWSLQRSWDAMRIAKPFSRVLVQVSPPIYVPADADEAALEVKRQELQEALDATDRRGDAWRKAG